MRAVGARYSARHRSSQLPKRKATIGLSSVRSSRGSAGAAVGKPPGGRPRPPRMPHGGHPQDADGTRFVDGPHGDVRMRPARAAQAVPGRHRHGSAIGREGRPELSLLDRLCSTAKNLPGIRRTPPHHSPESSGGNAIVELKWSRVHPPAIRKLRLAIRRLKQFVHKLGCGFHIRLSNYMNSARIARGCTRTHHPFSVPYIYSISHRTDTKRSVTSTRPRRAARRVAPPPRISRPPYPDTHPDIVSGMALS